MLEIPYIADVLYDKLMEQMETIRPLLSNRQYRFLGISTSISIPQGQEPVIPPWHYASSLPADH